MAWAENSALLLTICASKAIVMRFLSIKRRKKKVIFFSWIFLKKNIYRWYLKFLICRFFFLQKKRDQYFCHIFSFFFQKAICWVILRDITLFLMMTFLLFSVSSWGLLFFHGERKIYLRHTWNPWDSNRRHYLKKRCHCWWTSFKPTSSF